MHDCDGVASDAAAIFRGTEEGSRSQEQMRAMIVK
jgi:hypothetical protein